MTKASLSTFAECLKRVRKEKGFSQEKLALKADVDRSHIGRIEQGKVTPGFEVMQKLAKALDTEVRKMC